MTKEDLITAIMQVNMVSIMTNEERLAKDKVRMIPQNDLFIELCCLSENQLKLIAQELNIKQS